MGINVFKYGAGGAIRMGLEVSEAEHKNFFSVSHWNAIKRAGLYQAGAEWVALRLPLRFTDFAYQLGYNAKSHRGQRGKSLPLVQYGRLRQFLLEKAYPEARATTSKTQLILRLPVPSMLNRTSHGVSDTGVLYSANRIVNNTITTITNEELLQIAKDMVETMNALIGGAKTTVSRSGITRKSLTVTQRKSISHTVKPQGSIHKVRN